MKSKEEIFNEVAERMMTNWIYPAFSVTHPMLKRVILQAMQEYADQETAQDKWIRVEKGLPKPGHDYIVFDAGLDEIALYYLDNDKRFYNLDLDEDRTKYVTHYQSPPKSPQK